MARTLFVLCCLTATALAQSVTQPVSGRTTDRFWPEFPVPQKVYVLKHPQQTPDGRVMEQTLSGLLAYETRTAGHGPMVWLPDKDFPPPISASRTWRLFQDRYHSPVENVSGAWELLHHMASDGRVAGYVLYHRDATPMDKPAQDFSLNLAVSMCAPLHAVAIEQSLQSRAKDAGLKELADTRGKNYAWLFAHFGSKFSRDLVALEDPRRDHYMRDLAVAVGAVVVSSAPGGGYDAALQRAHIAGTVFGWDSYEEYKFVNRASVYGLRVVPADWLLNAPLSMAGETGLDFPAKRRVPLRVDTSPDDPTKHYVAFILSDGDNVCWTTGDLTYSDSAWGCKLRGTMPFGWGAALMDALQINPYAVAYLDQTATANDELLQYATGYCYIDTFGQKRGGIAALRRLMTKSRPYLLRTHATVMQSFVTNWKSQRAQRAYAVTAAAIPELKGLFITQYHPYAAGEGAIRWVSRPDGRDLAVLTPLIALWHGVQDPKHFADIEPAAQAINRWAQRPVKRPEDRFTWIIVHAWSKFPFNGQIRQRYQAAAACAGLLDKNMRVVTPTELVDRLCAAHSRQER